MTRHARVCLVLALLVLLCLAQVSTAGLFPSLRKVAPAFQRGDNVSIMAGTFTSKSKVMPLKWEDVFACPVPRPEKRRHRNIGQVLFGDSIQPSGYSVRVLVNESCRVVCQATLNEKARKRMVKLIEGNYRGNLFLDGLPAVDARPENRRVRTGFRMGQSARMLAQKQAAINNHLSFIIYYHKLEANEEDREEYRIVEFDVIATSIPHGDNPCSPEAIMNTELQFPTEGPITFSYSALWLESDREWSTRWDIYMKISKKESRIHWFTIINFFIIVVLQSLALWLFLVRVLRRDISYYNSEDPLMEGKEESGWKLVHGDVLRKPRGAGLLSILAGTGCQLACMVGATLLIACLGFVSPSSRGLLVTILVFLYVFFSFVNGFVTAALTKFFKMRSWKLIFVTAGLFPAVIFAGYLTLNFVHLGSRAASTLPFSSLLLLLLMWIGVSAPLCLAGAALGFGTDLTTAVKINNIPRTIPPQPWYMRSIVSYIALGLVPFAASYIELSYIFSSMWQGSMYYMFGFLLAVYVLMLVLVAQMSVFSTYYQLNLLDYHWWWRSFWVSSSYGVWLMAYCVYYYYFASMVMGFLGTVLYYGYMTMVSVSLSVLFGSVGLLASFLFVRIIYSSLKVD